MVFGNNQGKLKSFETLRIYFSPFLWGNLPQMESPFLSFPKLLGGHCFIFNKLFGCIVHKVLEKGTISPCLFWRGQWKLIFYVKAKINELHWNAAMWMNLSNILLFGRYQYLVGGNRNPKRLLLALYLFMKVKVINVKALPF